jgi:rSAM/selenodomain-associated transferase 2
MISVIIPTYNEASCEPVLKSLSVQTDKDFEVIISNGSINPIQVKTQSCKLKIIQSPKGRGLQMNKGVEAANGDILWFLHADSVARYDAIATIKYSLSKPKIQAGAFELSFDSNDVYFKVISFLGTLRSKWTRIPFGDQGIFIEKNLFESIGGFENSPLMEDISLMTTLKKMGKRIVILPKKLKTSPRRYLEKGKLKTTMLNLWFQLQFKLGVSSDTISKAYYGK